MPPTEGAPLQTDPVFPETDSTIIEDALRNLKRYWGYDRFLPLQQQVVERIAAGRDTILVLPTGGGKSIGYQLPALLLPGLAIVVSPLIALMKDQVDALQTSGVPAARLDSSMGRHEQQQVFQQLESKQLKLLYLSPERLMTQAALAYLKQFQISFVAVDEAHCVSMWGHDFRPEYRELGRLKEVFPGLPMHAFTATATRQVRQDIHTQLQLEQPAELIGSFDRPNLHYRVARRENMLQQVREIIDRFPGDAGIIYCLRRSDVESLTETLQQNGCQAHSYHAGMDSEQRRFNQDLFIRNQGQIMVATIAFGMGIDKPDVRYVIHTAMPKSLEHYQQESGRAGRDGLPAHCLLLHGGNDFMTWKRMISDMEPEAMKIALQKLNQVNDYCNSVVCRHRTLQNYFGQAYDRDNCGACDICDGEFNGQENAGAIARSIIGAVLESGERYGGDLTSQILAGSRDRRILENELHTLSAWGELQKYSKRQIRNWLEQLAGQGLLEKTLDYQVLKVTRTGYELLHSDAPVRLLKSAPVQRRQRLVTPETDDYTPVDRELFETLRRLRTRLAHERGLPPYVIFGDAALREMARHRPTTHDQFLSIRGVGQAKNREFGSIFLRVIRGDED